MCPHPATCGVRRPTSVHHRVADLRDQGLDRRICLCHRVCMSLRQTVEFMTPNRHALQPIHPSLRKWSASRLARRSILPTGRVIRRARWPRTPAGVGASPDCLSPSAASLRNPLEGPADRSGARRGAGIEWRGVADKSSAIARESRHPGGPVPQAAGEHAGIGTTKDADENYFATCRERNLVEAGSPPVQLATSYGSMFQARGGTP